MARAPRGERRQEEVLGLLKHAATETGKSELGVGGAEVWGPHAGAPTPIFIPPEKIVFFCFFFGKIGLILS